MASRKPLGLYGGSPGQFRSGDYIPVECGGTGVTTYDALRANLQVQRWYFGTGTPNDVAGTPGDFYVDSDNKLWRKGEISWGYSGIQFGSLVSVPVKNALVNGDYIGLGDSENYGNMCKTTLANFRESLGFREKLKAPRTYYVRPDGSDINDGLANTAGGAFKTIDRAVNIVSNLDRGTSEVTINVSDGIYGHFTLLPGVGSKPVRLIGNVSNPEAVTITGKADSNVGSITAIDCGSWELGGFFLNNTDQSQNSRGILAKGATVIKITGAFIFGSINNSQIRIEDGAQVLFQTYDQIRITAGSTSFAQVDGRGSLLKFIDMYDLSIDNTPNFNYGLMVATNSANIELGDLQIYGDATGTKFQILYNSSITTSLMDESTWPGTFKGVVDTTSYFGAPNDYRVVRNGYFFVSPTGNDNNSGADSSMPLATITRALNLIQTYDNRFTAGIILAPGTYTVPKGHRLPYIVGNGDLEIRGSDMDATKTIVRSTGAMVVDDGVFSLTGSNSKWKISNLTVSSTATGTVTGLLARAGSELIFSNVNFGSGLSIHMRAMDNGVLTPSVKYSIAASASTHMLCSHNSMIRSTNVAVTTPSNVAFTTFAIAQHGGVINIVGPTFTGAGTITGQRFRAESNGVFNTNGSGPQVFPGDTAGTVITGGVYDTVVSERERITAARTYYVRADGSDTNTGLGDSAAGALQTLARALVVASELDFNSFNVTIKLADGTYPQIVVPPIVGNGTLWIEGNTSAPGNVIIASPGAAPAVRILHMNAACQLNGLTLRGTSGPRAAFGNLSIQNCIIENVTQAAFDAQLKGRLVINGPVTIRNSTNMVRVFVATEAGILYVVSGITITIQNAPTLSGEFCNVTGTGTSALFTGVIFSGSVYGKRYDATLNSVITVGGAGTSYLPGTTAGTTATGGQYG